MELSRKMKIAATTTAVSLVCAGATYLFLKHKNRLREAVEALNYLNIKIVSTEVQCDEVVKELRQRIKSHRAVGFDCEWVTEHGKRRPVALVQLASVDGYCGLFCLCQLNGVPDCLRDLLEDRNIYKVGVVPGDDAKYLFQDYGVSLQSSLDIRHIAELCGYQAGGLAALSKNMLGIILDKNWKIRCSNWQAEKLSDKQIQYAAADAYVAIKIFIKLIDEYQNHSWFQKIFTKNNVVWKGKDIDDLCWKFVDVNYKTKKKLNTDFSQVKELSTKEPTTKELTPSKRYPHATRSKPLYDNCYLEAPDGEMLCTCDSKKAMWYVEKQLADVVKPEPLTVRLRFEPAGRSVGESGRYYTLVKENRCVVCGADNSYIRKNIVPREYRKNFPEIMKDHVSHDVVLLCTPCHQASNMRDQRLRERLVALCSAPLGCSPHAAPYIEDVELKKARSAARALLYQSRKHVIPEARRAELEAVLLKHYRCNEVTQILLEDAAEIVYNVENLEYESHGKKVVDYYLNQDGGLLKLEQLWRENFLSTMKPRYMPELWSVTHSEQRLRVRLNEGRLSEDEIRLIGLSSKWL